jgi:hypothetical protein
MNAGGIHCRGASAGGRAHEQGGSMRHRGREIKRLTTLVGLSAVVVLLTAMPASGQTLPIKPPLAASSNVHPMEHIPGSAAGMVFKDHYAYVSGWTGITVLDIADADSPQVVGELPLPHFENEDVDLCGNTLIVVNDRAEEDLGAVLYVVNIENPAQPIPAASCRSVSPAAGGAQASSPTS